LTKFLLAFRIYTLTTVKWRKRGGIAFYMFSFTKFCTTKRAIQQRKIEKKGMKGMKGIVGYATWAQMLYTEEEFAILYGAADGFNDDINRNCRTRDDSRSFATFIDEGGDALLRDHSDFVACLI